MSQSIVLYQFPRLGNIPNVSAFCMKLETYLRMAHRDYSAIVMHNPRKSPIRSKMPFIKYGNEYLGDSSLIIDRLESESETPLDHHLSTDQKAEKICLQRMLEDHLYWVIVYSRWRSKQGWPAWSARLKKNMPPLIGSFILSRIQAYVANQLRGQGIGRFDEETIFKMGDRLWYFNDQPSTMDAIIYSFLGSCLANFWPNPLTEYVRTHENLMRYYNHMQSEYFHELELIKS